MTSAMQKKAHSLRSKGIPQVVTMMHNAELMERSSTNVRAQKVSHWYKRSDGGHDGRPREIFSPNIAI